MSVCVTKLCVTKLDVKHGGRQVVYNKVVCEIWCVTSCVWNMMGDNLCVIKLCVKTGV